MPRPVGRPPGKTPAHTSNKDKKGQEKRRRCGKCEPCLRTDCGECEECVNKKRFGGDGSSRQSCLFKRCVLLYPASAVSASAVQQHQPVPMTKRMARPPATSAPDPTSVPENARKGSKISSEQSKRYKRNFPPTGLLESQLLKHESEGGRSKKLKTITSPKFMGRTLPFSPIGACARCQTDKDETVLLCDGKGCSMEYHLSCAGLEEIPEGDWLCVDCHVTGAGYDALVSYLELVDEKRTDYETSDDFCKTLVDRAQFYSDLQETGVVFASGKEKELSNLEEHWIGKPICMRLPGSTSTPVCGRIVDVRRHLIGKKVHPDEREYLIRFAAGHQGRKKTYHHWICLEEHQMLVGDRIVWAVKGNDATPAMAYLRTRLEIAAGAAEDKAESPSSRPLAKGATTSLTETGIRNQHIKKPVTIGYFGVSSEEKFEVLDAEQTTIVDFLDSHYQEKFAPTHRNEAAAAKAETQEQEAVRKWFSLQESSDSRKPKGQPFHSLALSKRDYFSLPPLVLKGEREANPSSAAELHTQLCPLVPARGSVDRNHLLTILKGQVRPSKEAILSIEEVPYRQNQQEC